MSLFLSLLFLFPFLVYSDSCECGIEGVASRIYRGQNAETHKYPWIALIKVNQGSYRISPFASSISYSECGGSLIDAFTILTAKHCVTQSDRLVRSDSIEVHLNISNSREVGLVRRVAQIFTPSRSMDSDSEDIAILRLSERVPITKFVSPICLPSFSSEAYDMLTIAGFGKNDAYGSRSYQLKEAQVNYITRSQCSQLKRRYIQSRNPIMMFLNLIAVDDQIEADLICALNSRTGADACAGDSGGPLMQKNPWTGRWFAIGIVHGAWEECGIDHNIPGLYVSTAKYNYFIRRFSNACFM